MKDDYYDGPILTNKQMKYYDISLNKSMESINKYPKHLNFKLSTINNLITVDDAMSIKAHYIADIKVTSTGNEFRWGNKSNEYKNFSHLIQALKQTETGIFKLENYKFPYSTSELWFIGKIINDINQIRTNKLEVQADVKQLVDQLIPESLQYELLYLLKNDTTDSLFIVTECKPISQIDKINIINTIDNLYLDKNNFIFFPHNIKIKVSSLNNEQKSLCRTQTLPKYLPFIEKFILNMGYVCKINNKSNRIQFLKPISVPKIENNKLYNLLQVQYEANFNIIFAYTLIDGVYKFIFDLDLGNASDLIKTYEMRPELADFDNNSESSIICYAGCYLQYIIDDIALLNMDEKIDVNDLMLASFEIGKNVYCFGIIALVDKVKHKLVKMNIDVSSLKN